MRYAVYYVSLNKYRNHCDCDSDNFAFCAKTLLVVHQHPACKN